MVARSYNIHARIEQLSRHLARDAEAVGRILSVQYDKIGHKLHFQPVDRQGKSFPANITDNIAESQHPENIF
jgi:hypothetical protein